MKKLKKAFYAIVFAIAFSFTFQCASPKVATTKLEQQTPFIVKTANFQEWYSGIKVGSTGINVFIPIIEVNDSVVLENVYFRNLKGKLTKRQDKYVAVLKNPSRYYTFQKAQKSTDFLFNLKDDECVISYTENGQKKYYKIIALDEVAGTYYENGPPSVYTRPSSNGMASLDEEEDDN